MINKEYSYDWSIRLYVSVFFLHFGFLFSSVYLSMKHVFLTSEDILSMIWILVLNFYFKSQKPTATCLFLLVMLTS